MAIARVRQGRLKNPELFDPPHKNRARNAAGHSGDYRVGTGAHNGGGKVLPPPGGPLI